MKHIVCAMQVLKPQQADIHHAKEQFPSVTALDLSGRKVVHCHGPLGVTRHSDLCSCCKGFAGGACAALHDYRGFLSTMLTLCAELCVHSGFALSAGL